SICIQQSPPAATRCFAPDPFSRRRFVRYGSGKKNFRASRQNTSLSSGSTALSTLHSTGPFASPLAQERHDERLEEFHLTHHPVATGMNTLSSRTTTDLVLQKADWMPMLHHLGISDGGVRHVDVTARGSAVIRPRPCPSRDRLIIAETSVSKEEVVHRPRTVCCELQRLQQQICQALARFHISRSEEHTSELQSREN